MNDAGDFPEIPHERQLEETMRVFKSRLARLSRLVELEAPVVILIRETQLLAKAGEQLSPHYWYETIKHDAEIKARRAYGLCIIPDCDKSAARGDPGPEGPFDRDYCAKHAAQAEQEMREDDADEAEEEGLS